MGRKVLCVKKKGARKNTDSGFTAGVTYEVDENGVKNDQGSTWINFLNTSPGSFPAEKWINWTEGISKYVEFTLVSGSIRRF